VPHTKTLKELILLQDKHNTLLQGKDSTFLQDKYNTLPQGKLSILLQDKYNTLPQGKLSTLLQAKDNTLLQAKDNTLPQGKDNTLLQGKDNTLLQDKDSTRQAQVNIHQVRVSFLQVQDNNLLLKEEINYLLQHKVATHLINPPNLDTLLNILHTHNKATFLPFVNGFCDF
jgi:hypothetical protein